jgi:hypothetical protein
MPDDPRASTNWWQTLPGVLTAMAAILTAVTGLLALLFQYGVLGGKRDAPATSAPTHSSGVTKPDTPSSAPASASGTTKPWSRSDVVITTKNGVTTTLRAETLSNCISPSHELTIGSGQDIPFEKMKSFEVLRADPAQAPNAQATVLITLLDGRKIEDTVKAGCDIFGYNDLGRFTTYFDQLKRVDFQR